MTERPYKSSAWTYLIGDTVYVGPYVTYRGIGSRVETGPIEVFARGDYISAKKYVCWALGKFEADVRRPFDDPTKRLPQPVLKAAKIKSFKMLLTVAKTVEITEWPDGRVEFLPCRNEGPRMGYTPIFPAEIATANSEFGGALFRAYERCE